MRNIARAVGLAFAVVAIQALLVSFFAWPAIRTAPRDLPVVVAGPPAAAAAVNDRLEQARPGGFKITNVPDAAAADRALRNREAYGAFVVQPGGMSVHVASAASPTVAALLTQQAQGEVVDVVPVDADDPRGAGLASAFLPMVLTAMVAGAVLFLMVSSRWARLAGHVVFAGLAGLAGAAILQGGYGALPGAYLANAGVLALVAAAISAAVTGLAAVLGRAGIGLAALLVFVVGNPLSAISSAPEMLPQPWGQVGQLLPPGAGATLLRSVAYFDGAGGTAPAWTLAGWALVGLLLVAVAPRRKPHTTPAGSATASAEPELTTA